MFSSSQSDQPKWGLASRARATLQPFRSLDWRATTIVTLLVNFQARGSVCLLQPHAQHSSYILVAGFLSGAERALPLACVFSSFLRFTFGLSKTTQLAQYLQRPTNPLPSSPTHDRNSIAASLITIPKYEAPPLNLHASKIRMIRAVREGKSSTYAPISQQGDHNTIKMENRHTPSPAPDLNRNRLPTLFEVLSRRTLPPVDLFSFYIFMRDQQRSVDYLDFWCETLQRKGPSVSHR